MIKYVTLALLIISVAYGIEPNGLSKAGEGRNAKDDFELVMGAKATPLRSRASFSLAIDHAGQTSIKKDTGINELNSYERALIDTTGGPEHFSYSRQLGCLPYSIALEVLRNQDRDNVAQSAIGNKVVPFLVNKNRNAICVFFTQALPEVKKNFIFHYDIPVSLIIDKQLYAVIDKMFESNATLHQALGAVPEKRDILLVVYPYKHDAFETSRARIKHVVNSLVTYPNEVFESFFWANKNISDYLERMCSQRRLDRQTKDKTSREGARSDDVTDEDGSLLYLDTKRHVTWTKLFAHLKEKILPSPLPRELIAAGEDNTNAKEDNPHAKNDPCQFARMIKGMHSYADKVVFPMEYLQGYKDEKLASACLAFLGARLAMPTLLKSGHRGSDIFHIALEFGPSLYNYRARSIPQSMTSAQTEESMPYTQAGIRGAGQVVGVADTGIDRSSCYFNDPAGMVAAQPVPSKSFDAQYRKVIQYNYIQGQADDQDTASGHGTHVAGTVAGSVVDDRGSGDALYNGAAPDAKIAFVDMTSSADGGLAVPDSADDLYAPSYAAGARLHSNSWGSNHNGRGYYTNSDSDGWLYEHQDYLALYAAGNNGGAQAYLISQESQGKNCLSIGAGESPSSIASFSSIGPSYDNRFKPDIVLPGSGTISAEASGMSGQGSCLTGPKSGTSMATPAASGNGALIRDYLATKWADICMDSRVTPDTYPENKQDFCTNMDNPSGVLVKAILLHGGQKMTSYAGNTMLGDVPDSKQGYGILYLGNVLPLPAAGTNYAFGLFIHDYAEIKSGESIIYTIAVTDKSKPIKVSLSWYDPANQNGISTTALLHDLDLSVTSQNGDVYWGNHRSESGNKPDRLNNNEQVMISTPDEQLWTVKVSANELVKDESQKYALVITMGGFAYQGDDKQTKTPSPSLPTTQSPTYVSDPAPVPAPEPGKTSSPTTNEDNPPGSEPSEPPKWADDDHFHHRHPGNDDWHSHKRNPDKEDDYLPPQKKNEKAPKKNDQSTHDLTHIEQRLIDLIRGVFAGPAANPI